MLLAAAICVATALPTSADDATVAAMSDGERELWTMMRDGSLITQEQYEHVLEHGQMPSGAVVEGSPVAAEDQGDWQRLAQENVISGEELAYLLFKGTLPDMTEKEVRAFKELAPVYEPDARRRLKYDVRRKHIAVRMIRWKQGRGAELKKRHEDMLAEAEERGIPVRWEDPDGQAGILMHIDSNGNPRYMVTFNAVASANMNTTAVRPEGSEPFGLTGTNTIVGVLDYASVITTHQEFAQNRVVQEEPYGQHEHTTQITGTIAAKGVDAAAKGMAPEVNVVVNCEQPPYLVLADWAIGRPNLLLAIHAMGTQCGWTRRWYNPSVIDWNGSTNSATEDPWFGAYARDSWDWDNQLYDNPYQLLVVPVGNDARETYWGSWHYCDYHNTYTNDYHPEDGLSYAYPHDCIPPSATMKNALTVGSAEPTGGTGLLSYAVARTSSRGMTDDGRAKPDIVGCGDSVYTTHDASDTNYSIANGSSFSAAAVMGSLALVQELHERIYTTNCPMLSSTLATIARHTAHDIGWVGPDWDSGWGVLDTSAACWIVSNNAAYFNSLPHLFEVRLEDSGEKQTASRTVFVTNATAPLKVSAGWTDPPGPLPPEEPELDDDTPILVNDIDLRVVGPNAQTNRPWMPYAGNTNGVTWRGDNTIDNMEQVYIANPSNGMYTILVSYKGALSNGYQDVSVVISGNTPTNGPDYEITDIGAMGSGPVVLTWPGVVGAVYDVGQEADLMVSNLTWNTVDTVAPNHEGSIVWTNDTATTNMMFYRLHRLR